MPCLSQPRRPLASVLASLLLVGSTLAAGCASAPPAPTPAPATSPTRIAGGVPTVVRPAPPPPAPRGRRPHSPPRPPRAPPPPPPPPPGPRHRAGCHGTPQPSAAPPHDAGRNHCCQSDSISRHCRQSDGGSISRRAG